MEKQNIQPPENTQGPAEVSSSDHAQVFDLITQGKFSDEEIESMLKAVSNYRDLARRLRQQRADPKQSGEVY
jgi:hypothetical protein